MFDVDLVFCRQPQSLNQSHFDTERSRYVTGPDPGHHGTTNQLPACQQCKNRAAREKRNYLTRVEQLFVVSFPAFVELRSNLKTCAKQRRRCSFESILVDADAFVTYFTFFGTISSPFFLSLPRSKSPGQMQRCDDMLTFPQHSRVLLRRHRAQSNAAAEQDGASSWFVLAGKQQTFYFCCCFFLILFCVF